MLIRWFVIVISPAVLLAIVRTLGILFAVFYPFVVVLQFWWVILLFLSVSWSASFAEFCSLFFCGVGGGTLACIRGCGVLGLFFNAFRAVSPLACSCAA